MMTGDAPPVRSACLRMQRTYPEVFFPRAEDGWKFASWEPRADGGLMVV